jgi:ComF family protein
MSLVDILDIFYPRRCIACQKLLTVKGNKWLCKDCKPSFVPVKTASEFCCQICGRPIEHDGNCVFCNTEKTYYQKGGCLYSYKDDVRKAFFRFKFRDRPDYAKFFGKKMADNFDGNKSDYDFVTAVPMFPKKQRQRGYNQSEKLAQIFAKETGIRYKRVLIKKKDTQAQRELKSEQRRKNIKNAFAVNTDISGRSILLIDDVVTTGYTVNECCRVLKKAGAERVDFYALCTRDRDCSF